LYIYLLTPRCRFLLEKLTVLKLVKEFPTFHGTGRFITTLTSVRHLSLSWASPILPFGFNNKNLHTPSPHPYAPHAQPISFFSILSHAQNSVRTINHLAPLYAISSIPPCNLLHYIYIYIYILVWYPYAGFSLHTDTTPSQPNHNATPTHIEP